MSRLLYRLMKIGRLLAVGDYAKAFLLHGAPATTEHVSVLAPLGCSTVIDVGAHRGEFALVARRCFPEARLDSFEPLPAAFSHLEQVTRKDPLTTIHQVALGERSGETTIHVSRRDHSSSLLPITARQSALFRGTDEKSEHTIREGRLSEFVDPDSINEPALLKLDVQGYELQVLRGCADLLDRFSHVYVECSFVELYEGQALADEVIVWLYERGFRLRGVYNALFRRNDRSAIQADFLFTNGRSAS